MNIKSVIALSSKFINKNLNFIVIMLTILLICCASNREGFKAFDQCKNGSYPLDFCINIPFNSEGLYRSWEELEDTTRQRY